MLIIPAYAALSDEFKQLIDLSLHNIGARNLYNYYVSHWHFDEHWYLESNPDLGLAIPSDVFPSGYSHFRSVGYREGRLPFKVTVNGSWYMANYPDVAGAILNGTIGSPSQHFFMSGYAEGRLPDDPEIDVDWYSRTYLPSAETGGDKPAECLHHFLHIGYLSGAVPRPTTA